MISIIPFTVSGIIGPSCHLYTADIQHDLPWLILGSIMCSLLRELLVRLCYSGPELHASVELYGSVGDGPRFRRCPPSSDQHRPALARMYAVHAA